MTATRDVIKDFHPSQHDIIDVSEIDANRHVFGDQSFTLIGSAKFGGNEGEMRSFYSGSNTIVSADTDGDKAANFSITIAAHVKLSADDFLL